MAKKKTMSAPCNACGHITKHEILAERVTWDRDQGVDGEDGEELARNTYRLIECCGCEAVSMRHEYCFMDAESPTIRYYPPQVGRSSPKWLWDLPGAFRTLLEEIYAALAADGKRLASMGARTVVDMVMTDKVGDVGTFAQKLKALEVAGFVSPKNREYLATALDAGHAASHRGHVPSDGALDQLMDIVENLVETVYVLPKVAEKLRETTPRRPKAPQKPER